MGASEDIRAATDAHRVFGVAQIGKRLFKLLHHRATNESTGPQRLLKHFRQLLLEFRMRSDQIEKRNIGMIAHFVISSICST